MRKEKFAILGGTLLLAGGMVLDHFTDYANINDLSDFPSAPLTAVMIPELGVSETTTLAYATVPYLFYPYKEMAQALDMDVLHKATKLTSQEVRNLFGEEPALGETWWAVFFEMTYPNDGGPAKVGIQVGPRTLALNSEGINLFSQVIEQLKDGHDGDVEKTIVYVRVVGDELFYMGIDVNQHGDWQFHKAEELIFVRDDRGGLHPLLFVSLKKKTEYINLLECNTAKVEIVIGWLRDKCPSSGFTFRPQILELHNVDRHEPFKESPILLKKYEGKETVFKNGKGACFYAGNREKLGKKPKCRAEFNFKLPPRR
jgi:hypothetical protein